MKLKLLHTDGIARRGQLDFAHGVVRTSAFIPVETYAMVKAMILEEVAKTGADMLLLCH